MLKSSLTPVRRIDTLTGEVEVAEQPMTAMDRPAGEPARQPTLAVYVGEDCASCRVALDVAERVRREFPHVAVSVFDLSVSSVDQPEAVFATPTFLLDGAVVSLGTPSWERLEPLLRATIID